jgi:hypothetical protein
MVSVSCLFLGIAAGRSQMWARKYRRATFLLDELKSMNKKLGSSACAENWILGVAAGIEAMVKQDEKIKDTHFEDDKLKSFLYMARHN